MQHITLIALNNCLFSSLTLPMEMLSAANEIARSRDRHSGKFAFDIAGTQPTCQAAGGMTIPLNRQLGTISQTDLIILPALWRNPLKALAAHRELLQWLQQMSEQGSVICAVGTSSCFLAAAGLLDGKPATTHWQYHELFAARFPRVNFKRQYLITQADHIYCAGSINSVADLMVHLASQFFGRSVGKKLEAQFSPEIRRPFEQHAYAATNTSLHNDETIIHAQEWLQRHYQQAIKTRQLAAQLQLSPRTLNRRFKAATGVTPGNYLLTIRLNSARELLRTSNLSIAEISEQVGFQDSSYFCQRFKQTMGQTPLVYRNTVRGKLFTVQTVQDALSKTAN